MARLQALWSPNEEREFATYGHELKLYTVTDSEGPSEAGRPARTRPPTSSHTAELKQLSSKHAAQLLAVNSDVGCSPAFQTVAWQPNQAYTHHFAVGQTNGKVTLVNLLSNDPISGTQTQQLVPKTLARACTCVVWNPTDNRLLAEGLEKTRSDSSLIVWDVTRARASAHDRPKQTSGGFRFGPEVPSGDDSNKFFEIGHGESTSTIAWLPNHTNCLVAGMGSRFLRIFDIRDDHVALQPCSPREVAQHKAIYGLVVDPHLPNQLASYAEGNTAYIWDIRQFNRPCYSFHRPGNVLKLSWIPTRPGCLSVLCSEYPYLRLVEVPYLAQSPDNQADKTELYMDYFSSHLSDRCPLVKLGAEVQPLTGVSWHPRWYCSALIVGNNGQLQELEAVDKIALGWSVRGDLTFPGHQHLFSTSLIPVSEKDGPKRSAIEDISVEMRRRVLVGYGFNAEKNAGLVKNVSLHRVWSWLQEQLLEVKNRPSSDQIIRGVSTVLQDLSSPTFSEAATPTSNTPSFPVYLSPQRDSALLLCGWTFCKDKSLLENFLKREELSDHFERAAAVAVFQGDVSRAISVLRNGAQSTTNQIKAGLFNLIALSLSGYSDKETSLWQETCSSVRAQISNPYLRAVFGFLCSGNTHDGFRAVLHESEMRLQDRVAFACCYLDNRQLKDYIDTLCESVIYGGVIEGLFLTGLDEKGVELLGNYVNETGDVQTACLIAGQVLPSLSKNKLVLSWFDGYRDLLDQWQMWRERAEFDNERQQLDGTFKPSKQAAIMCPFCSKAISSDMLRQDRLYTGNKALARKSTSCPSCRKPLPRCMLCLLHMSAGPSKWKDNGASNLSDPFGQWFTWCQTCWHGGHASHLTEWFKNHKECPVTNCSCRCFSLDCLS